jgi:hypothetical protein
MGCVSQCGFHRDSADRWTRPIDLISSGSVWHVLHLGLGCQALRGDLLKQKIHEINEIESCSSPALEYSDNEHLVHQI